MFHYFQNTRVPKNTILRALFLDFLCLAWLRDSRGINPKNPASFYAGHWWEADPILGVKTLCWGGWGRTREAPEKWPNKHFDSVNVSGPLGHAQTLVNGEKSFILIFIFFQFCLNLGLTQGVDWVEAHFGHIGRLTGSVEPFWSEDKNHFSFECILINWTSPTVPPCTCQRGRHSLLRRQSRWALLLPRRCT